jgi:hypothetical protein
MNLLLMQECSGPKVPYPRRVFLRDSPGNHVHPFFMTAPEPDQNPSNIHALGAIYSAMLFEELKAFQAVDKLVELFQQGLLPVGTAGGLLQEWAGARASIAAQMRSQRELLVRLLAQPELRSAPEMGQLIEHASNYERGVRGTVSGLLSASEAFAQLPTSAQEQIARDTSRVADFIADVDFPQFVASLLAGTFDAIVSSSIEQMEAYGKLVAAVTAALDEFLDDATTGNGMRDHLVDRYPDWFDAQEADNCGLAGVLIKGIRRVITPPR